MTADDTPAQAGAWLPIPEAARRLRIHVRTVHRWLDDGRLTKRELGRGRVEVWVAEHMLPDDAPESTPETPQDTPISLTVMGQQMAMMDRFGALARQHAAEQMAPLLEELAATRRQMAEQAEELGRLREVERELTAELERLATPDPAPDRRRWWRFWI